MYAVLIPLVKTESGDALLLEVRSEKVRQPGEVCFPGGRSECGETVTETAVRETCEELGLRPEDIEIISERDSLIMGDGREIHPVEARLCIDGTSGLRLSEDEVAEIFLLPLDWLKENPPVHYDLSAMADDELPDKLLGYLSHYGNYRDHGETDWLEYEDHGIWGLTARILKVMNYTIPKDPNILYSYMNMMLRDRYSSLEEFCTVNDANADEIKDILKEADYTYDPELNQFR